VEGLSKNFFQDKKGQNLFYERRKLWLIFWKNDKRTSNFGFYVETSEYFQRKMKREWKNLIEKFFKKKKDFSNNSWCVLLLSTPSERHHQFSKGLSKKCGKKGRKLEGLYSGSVWELERRKRRVVPHERLWKNLQFSQRFPCTKNRIQGFYNDYKEGMEHFILNSWSETECVQYKIKDLWRIYRKRRIWTPENVRFRFHWRNLFTERRRWRGHKIEVISWSSNRIMSFFTC